MSVPLNRFYEFGDFRLDSLKRTLHKDGESIALKGKAFDLLLFMVKSSGEILTHEQILDTVWEGTFVEQANLKKNISTLRKVLGEQPEESNYIQTLPKKGYRFVAQVHAPADESHISYDADGSFSEHLQVIDFSDDPNKIIHQTPYDISESPRIKSVESKPAGFPVRAVIQMAIPVLVLALGVSAYFFWKNWRRPALIDNLKLEKVKLQKLSTGINIQTSAISPDGNIVVYATNEEGDKQALWMRRIGAPNTLQLVPPSDMDYRAIVISPDNNYVYYGVTIGRTTDILYQIAVLGGIPRKIVEGIQSPASFSPDGKRIAFVRDDSTKGRTLYTVNAADGSDEREVFTTSDAHNLINPRFSPDGKRFAFLMGEATPNGRLWSLAEMPAIGGKITYITQPQKNKLYDFSWLIDGSGFIVINEPPDSKQLQIYRVSYPNGEITRLTNDFLDYEEIGVSADGKNVLALQKERTGNLWSVDPANLNAPTRLNTPQNPFGRFALLPNGQIIYPSTESGQRILMLADADGNNARRFTAEGNFAERDPAISPDGKTVIFMSRQSGTEEIWQADLNGGNLQQLTDDRTFLATPQISQDGKWLYYQRFDETAWHLIRLSLETRQSSIVFEDSILEFDISPDGQYVAYGLFNKEKKKWNIAVRSIADNKLQKQFEVAASTFIKWTADGKGLLYNVSDVWREGGDIWYQPIDGGPPKLYLEAAPQKIYTAEVTADGKKLYYLRGTTTSSIVLIKTE